VSPRDGARCWRLEEPIMTKTLLGCVALLALAAGCATAPARDLKKVNVKVVPLEDLSSAKLDPDKTYVCEEGEKTGLRGRRTICQTVRQRELEREAAQDQLRRAMQTGVQRP